MALPAAAAAPKLAQRFASDELLQPQTDRSQSELTGVANLYFPDWMEGTWTVTQTLTGVSAPLGLRFSARLCEAPLHGSPGRAQMAAYCA